MQVPTIHGIPAPNFGGSTTQGVGGESGQPFVFAEDFEDMDLSSGHGDSDVPHPAFHPQSIPSNPNRTSPRDLFAPIRPLDPHDHTSNPSRQPNSNYCQH